VQCPPPADRCVGYTPSADAVACGVGYKAESIGCQACDTGYYQDIDGLCVACPADLSLSARVVPVLTILAGFAGLAVVMLAVVVAVNRLKGAPIRDSLRRSSQFVMMMVGVLQLLAQVGRAAAPGLPPVLKGLYTSLSVLVFERVSLPPACFSGDRFYTAKLQLGGVLALMAALVLLQVSCALVLSNVKLRVPPPVWRGQRRRDSAQPHHRDIIGAHAKSLTRRRVVVRRSTGEARDAGACGAGPAAGRRCPKTKPTLWRHAWG
jgi:hypothetical protein